MENKPPFKITQIDYPEETFRLISPFWKGNESFHEKAALLETILDILGYSIEDVNREMRKKLEEGITPKEYVDSLKAQLEIRD